MAAPIFERLRPVSGRDRCRWASAIGLGAAAALTVDLVFWYSAGMQSAWLHLTAYTDIQQMILGGSAIWHGHLPAVYSSDPGFLALPLSLLVTAPLTPLHDAFRGSIPSHDLATVVAGTYLLLMGIVVLHAVRALAWDLGCRRRLWLLQIAALVLVILPEFEYAHADDVLALAAVLYALRRLAKSDLLGAALLISVATSFQQWALMLVPLLVFSAPKGRRTGTVVAATALPVALVVASLALDGGAAFRAFFSPNPSDAWVGHAGFDLNWLGGASSLAGRSLAVVAATAVGWMLRRPKDPARLLAVAAAILVLRPLTETVNYSYYWSPCLLTATLALVAARGHVRRTDLLWATGVMAWSIPIRMAVPVYSWWAGQLFLLAMLAVHLRRSLDAGGVHRPWPTSDVAIDWETSSHLPAVA